MAVANTPTQLEGDFKNLYKDSGLVDAIPAWYILQDRVQFNEAQMTGAYYVVGVTLQREHGFTYAPSSGSSSGVQTLNTPIAGFVGQALVEGYSIYLSSRISYDACMKASKAGKKAFASAYGAVLKNMKESHQYRLELSLLYGRDGLGIVSSNTSGALVITTASWATGIWASGMKDAILECFSSTAASSTQRNGDLTISAVDVATKTVTVTGTSSAVAAADILYFKGAKTASAYNEGPGLFRILSTTSGTLFNISTTSYELWKSQSYVVGGNLSLTAIMQAAALAMSFGLSKGQLLCAPEKFAQLASDEAALRRYVADVSKSKRGVKGISFQMGAVDIECLAHPMVRQGHAFLVPLDNCYQVGASPISFGLPGVPGDIQLHTASSTALELRSLSDVSFFCETPAQCVLLSSIS